MEVYSYFPADFFFFSPSLSGGEKKKKSAEKKQNVQATAEIHLNIYIHFPPKNE